MCQSKTDQTLALRMIDGAIPLIEKGWHKGSACANAEGRSVNVDNPDRCQYCLYGALYEIRYHSEEFLDKAAEFRLSIDTIIVAAGQKPYWPNDSNTSQLFRINDDLETQTEAVTLLKRAKSLLEGVVQCPGESKTSEKS